MHFMQFTRCMRYSILVLIPLFISCASLDKKDETLEWSEDKLYNEAKERMEDRDWVKAIKYFEILETRYPFGGFTQQAQINIAYSHWKDGEDAAALAATDRFLKLHPNHPEISYVYYLIGLINFNDKLGMLGRFSGQDLSERDPSAARNAFEAFSVLITRFPQSRYSVDARKRMLYIANSLARYELQVANYYFTNGAYLAAANRAQQMLKDAKDSPVAEEALVLMIKSYKAMNLTDLESDSIRILKQSFPESLYFQGKELKTGKQKSWWQIW